jgi:hypothetical protein
VIVLDEHMPGGRLSKAIRYWYKGKVTFVRDLRPGTVIKDDVIPQLLRQFAQPTFATINVSHFWQQVPIDQRFCVVCLDIPDSALLRTALLLKLLFSNPNFKTKGLRAGHVFRINLDEMVRYYTWTDREIRTFRL